MFYSVKLFLRTLTTLSISLVVPLSAMGWELDEGTWMSRSLVAEKEVLLREVQPGSSWDQVKKAILVFQESLYARVDTLVDRESLDSREEMIHLLTLDTHLMTVLLDAPDCSEIIGELEFSEPYRDARSEEFHFTIELIQPLCPKKD